MTAAVVPVAAAYQAILSPSLSGRGKPVYKTKQASVLIRQMLDPYFSPLYIKTMKRLDCRDAGFDCNGVIRAESDEEVLTQASQHAKEVHGVTVTTEQAAQLRTLIKDEGVQSGSR